MKGANIVGLDDLKLKELTPATANKAVSFIAENAIDRADLLHLLDVVRPTPHRVEADPSQRRAAPRHGISA